MSIDNALDDARDAATGFLNAEGRHPGHVLLGVGLTVGFALVATVFATRALAPTYDEPGDDHAPVTERPRGPLTSQLRERRPTAPRRSSSGGFPRP